MGILRFIVRAIINIWIFFSAICCQCLHNTNYNEKIAFDFLQKSVPDAEFIKKPSTMKVNFLKRSIIYKYTLLKWRGYGTNQAYYIAVSHNSEIMILETLDNINQLLEKEDLFLNSDSLVWDIIKFFMQVAYHGPGFRIINDQMKEKISKRILLQDLSELMHSPEVKQCNAYYSVKYYTIEDISNTIEKWVLTLQFSGKIDLKCRQVVYQGKFLKM